MRVNACPECKLQYDVGGYEAGTRLACRCGAVFPVVEPRPHEPKLLRCESCGGPLAEGVSACEWCTHPIPDGERHLTAVCPGCFARMSAEARFCGECGVEIAPQALAGVPYDAQCPRCSGRLVGRDVGADSIVECRDCGGIWLTTTAFRRLAKRAREEGRRAPVGGEVDTAELRGRHAFRYLPCVVCGDLMVPRNYGETSGIAIDVCRDHGVWLDADELPAIIAWLRAGHFKQRPEVTDPLSGAVRAMGAVRAQTRVASESRFDLDDILVTLGDFISGFFD